MKGWMVILACVALLAMGFFMGKFTTKPIVKEVVLPDVSRQADVIDKKNKQIHEDSLLIAKLSFQNDSLKLIIPKNHKKLSNDIKITKGFSRNRIKSYADSVYDADHAK